MTEDKVWKSLEPISSLLNLPLDNTETIDFYHATAREFITGNPVVTDKAFFIDDAEGYFIGFRLLALVNDIIDWNLYGIPTETSSGGVNKWKNFQEQLRNLPGHVKYALRHLFDHLDPSQLFSRNENELQHKFERFITRNLLSYLALNPRFSSSHVPDRLRHQVQHHPIRLLNETAYYNEHLLSISRHPWRYHPSSLRFIPPSSELFKQYGHLSDSRIHIFCFGDQLSHGNAIPLSKATLMLQSVVSSDALETRTIPVESRWLAHKFGAVDYKAEFDHTGTRNGTVTSAAISPDGRYVALGFGNGMIEVADIDDRCAVSQFQCDASNHPIWIEFVSGDCRIAVEDNKGRVIIFAHGAQPVRLKDPFPVSRYSVVTAVPQDRSLIVRAPGDEMWYKSVVVLSVSVNPSIQRLPFPHFNSSYSGLKHTAQSPPESPPIPFHGSLGFSPGARYVGAYDRDKAFVWSMESHELIAYYQVPSCPTWILNPGVGSPPSLYARHKPTFLRLSIHDIYRARECMLNRDC
ncbi:uncharacterized protein EI90DRAFT_3064735 [Cantharellus anzutake]|uniref:uncharacterized protein n=1 Tax=Cantharellus anzutake TaxID=1750568 RepID=UPI001903F522|nr:uncharacterized protein EI90DRAFT_3064735 [Cantharellus anzutake]KAF8328592.1 hypothetical protein EI90DRAFT_3064735 [Cantharellus anzutake]